MKKYLLRNALTDNATGERLDVFAAPVDIDQIKWSASQFSAFNFISLAEEGYHIYKLHLQDQDEVIQGLVSFRDSPGVLECRNMEIADFNKRGKPRYAGVGKAMIALCCQYAFDHGMDGYIAFDAKARLVPYYSRLGAKPLNSIRMYFDTAAALKLTARYFEKH